MDTYQDPSLSPLSSSLSPPDATAAGTPALTEAIADTTQYPIHPADDFGADTAPGFGVPPATPATMIERERACASARSLFTVPDEDTLEFARLPETVRDDVRRLLQTFADIHEAENKTIACKLQAVVFQGQRGFSWQSLWRKYYAYLQTHDWRCAMDKSKAGPAYWEADSRALPDLFLEHWRGLAGANQRKCKPAWRKLIDQWRRWRAGDRKAAIPGYDAPPPPDPATGRPRGWEYTNLMRHKPTRFELVAQRQGRSAAAPYRPLVFSTRVGLHVGEYFLFDDFWHDFKVITVGQRRAQRLLQFHALDLFSGCNFARGYKPVLEDEMTGAMERLKESEMVFLVAHVLSVFGYRPEGTILVVEHGTAAIRDDLEAKISDLTGGQVRVERSGMEGAAAFAGMYAGRSKGNYRCKAALESIGNLIHNETADTLLIPGQTGSNSRINQPEELFGRDKHTDALLRAMVALPPERAAMLRLPFLEFTQAIWLMNAIHDRINGRTDHELEGWKEAGLVASEWRMSDDQPWLPAAKLLTLPPDQRTVMEQYVHAQRDLVRARQLSPSEVFEGGRHGLITLPAHKTAMLLYECARAKGKLPARTVGRDHLIAFQDADLSPAILRYQADAQVPGRPPESLAEGEKYDGIVNPLDLDTLHLFDARGRYVGACPRWQKICRADTEALHRQCGRAAKIERELLEPVARRGAELTRQRIDDARHNAAVLSGKPLTPEDRERAQAIRRVDASAEALLDPDPGNSGFPESSLSAEALL